MKLLIYSHFFAPSVGGVETLVLSLTRGLAGLRTAGGEPEFLITLVTQTPAQGFDDASLPFRVVREPSFTGLRRLIRVSDVVHVAGPSILPLFLAAACGKRYVVEHHGYQAVCPNGLLIRRPDGGICPNHFLAREYGKCLRCVADEVSVPRAFLSLLLMFPRHMLSQRASVNLAVSNHSLKRCAMPHASLIYHGIENPLRSGARTDPDPASPAKFCFGYVGRLVSEKGVDVFLEAARILRDEGQTFEVVLVGDGPERPRLEAFIRRFQLQECVRITGFLTGADLTEALRNIRVVVMPSVWEETAGLSAIEQMMRGRLVIASDIGGLGEIVGEAGLKCPPGDARALADGMRKVLQDAALVNSLGRAARERALQLFMRQRMIDEHARIYRELVPAPPRQ